MYKSLLILVIITMWTANLFAGQWTWSIDTDASVQAEVSPLMYGKKWAYAVEIDDGPQNLMTIIQPLLAEFNYTDAPPGIAGGNVKPFVGGAGVIVNSSQTGHPIHLSWEKMQQLKGDGWEIINHGHAHIGRSWGNPPQILTQDQIDNELYWSQTILGNMIGQGRTPVTFIYPNGYSDYNKRLAHFGLLSGTRVAGRSTDDLYSSKLQLMDLTRRYLDDGYWNARGKADPLFDFPQGDGPAQNTMIIDFTHNIDKPETENYQRWQTRLIHIAKHYGKEGADTIWASSTGRIISYTQQAQKAKVSIKAGQLVVDFADDLPGSALTIHLTNLPSNIKLNAPIGGLLYRKGNQAWLTTPMLGLPGSALPSPYAKMIYQGEVKNLQWDTPVKVAGIRILQSQPVAEDYRLKIELTVADGMTQQIVPEDQQQLKKTWSRWLLFPIAPTQQAIAATELHIDTIKGLKTMEVWAIE